MTTITLKSFIANSAVPAGLIRAVVRQFGGWKEFSELADDVSMNGADAGWCGFIYYTDTVAFAKRQKSNILQMANDRVQEIGYDGLCSMLQTFKYLKDYSEWEISQAILTGKGEAVTPVFNTLAWYALEETARSFENYRESL